MKYMIVTEYPYKTLKEFVETREEAIAFQHPDKDRLSARFYELDSYKETVVEKEGVKHTQINYAIKKDTQEFATDKPECRRKN